MKRDLKNNIVPVQAIGAEAHTSDITGDTVDLKGYHSAAFVINPGTLTDGVFTPKLQESDNGSSWTDVAADDQEGTLAAIATDTVQWVGYKGVKRYVRFFVTVTGSPITGCVLGALGIKGHGEGMP